MRRVIVESPYNAGSGIRGLIGRWLNRRYARAALRDCLARGEAPLASHLLYTQPGVLRDDDPVERDLGIRAGLVWGQMAEATVVYIDRGISTGMRLGIQRAITDGRPVEERRLNDAYLPRMFRRQAAT